MVLVDFKFNSLHFLKPFLVFFTVSLISFSCVNNPQKPEKLTNQEAIDLPELIQKGKLTVLMENSAVSYFNYKGRRMGFEYEILKRFAADLGIELQVIVVQNLDSLITKLNRGEGDIIACNYTVTNERNKEIAFSTPYLFTHQVLIQRLPEKWSTMDADELEKNLILEPVQLGKKEVHVWKNSSYYQRLVHLQEEIGDSIHIQAVEGNIAGEELIEMVSSGIIDYTIAEENVARINKQFFENIHIDVALSLKQKIAFGLRKSSYLLKAKLDKWLDDFMKEKAFRYLYKKYFESSSFIQMNPNEHPALNNNNISQYDKYFKKAEEKTGVDWRLLASISYHESRFNADAQGFGGTFGLMQFMPGTAARYGVYPNSSPEVQIMGGAKKMKKDIDSWGDIPDIDQRIKFALATYNAGKGHIDDAQRLAEKHGLNPKQWDQNVELMILNLSKHEYYYDEVVKNGMLRGTTTYNYVKRIFGRYKDWTEVYK